MGRVSVGSLRGQTIVSTVKGNDLQKLEISVDSGSEKTVKIKVGSLDVKDPFKVPPSETGSSNLDKSWTASNVSVIEENEDLLEVRRAAAYRRSRLHPKSQVGTPREPEWREKVDRSSHLQKDRVIEGLGCAEEEDNSNGNKFSSRLKDSMTKKRMGNDRTRFEKDEKGLLSDLRHFVPSIGVPGNESNRFGTDNFLEKRLQSGFKNWAVLETESQKEPMDGTNAFLSRETCHSPSATSDSSSSLSTFESSSFSWKSEASSFAKREFSPSSVIPSGHFSNFRLATPIVPQPTTAFTEKQNGADIKSEHQFILSQNNRYGKQSTEEDYLEFKFFQGRMVESRGLWQSATGVESIQDRGNSNSDHSGSLEIDHAIQSDTVTMSGERTSLGVDEQDPAYEDSDEDWSSDFTSSTHSLASAYSQEFFSETWHHPYDVTDQQGKTPKQVHLHQAGLTEGGRYVDDWNVNVDDTESSNQVKLPSTSRIWKCNMESGSDVNEAPVEEGRVHLQSDTISRRNFSARDPEVLHDSPAFNTLNPLHQSSHGMGCPIICSPISHNRKSKLQEISVNRGMAASDDLKSLDSNVESPPAQVNSQTDVDSVLLGSQACPTRQFEAKESGNNVHTSTSSEKLVNISAKVPGASFDLPRPETYQGTQKGWSTRKYPGSDQETSGEPFLPVPETTRCLPLNGGANPVKPFSSAPSNNFKPRHSAAVKDTVPSKLLHGYFKCVQQDGLPCYTFLVDESEEVFFARAYKPEKRLNKEKCDWMYTFHSKRSNGKEKGGWKGWGKKEKPASDLVGKMKVSNILYPEVTRLGDIKHIKETEFVLFDDRAQHSTGSWSMSDRPLDDIPHHSTSLPSQKSSLQPRKGTLASTIVFPTSIPTQRLSEGIEPSSLINEGVRMENMNSDSHTLDPFKARLGHRVSFYGEAHNESSLIKPRVKQVRTYLSHMELAAIVISKPAEEQELESRRGKNPAKTETWGWGLKYLEKGSGSGWGLKFLERSLGSSPKLEDTCGVGAVPVITDKLESSEQHECDKATEEDRRCGEFQNISSIPSDRQASKEESPNELCSTHRQRSVKGHGNDLNSAGTTKPKRKGQHAKSQEKANVSIILPAGKHGLPTGEPYGPTPLIERWRSGGNCDCGGWDLGCGLTVLSTQRPTLHGTRNNWMGWLSPSNPLKIFTQDNVQKKVISLELVQGGLFSLSFQARLSPLQAFATAVAVLHQQMIQK